MTVVLCLASLSAAYADSAHNKRKPKKVELPPLPSGPTGPVPPIPLDSIAPVAPQVTYQDGQLTITATNSTLGDILRAVRKQTQAEIDIPDAKERVVTHLGPGPAREVIAELLNGSRFNYVLLGSAVDANALTRVVLVAKTGPDYAGGNQPVPQQVGMNQAARMVQPQQTDTNDADTAEESSDDNADETPAPAEQLAPPPDQPEIKTPQQMLQEMQQRQLQMQQQMQQQQGVPGNPGVPVPPQPQPQ